MSLKKHGLSLVSMLVPVLQDYRVVVTLDWKA